MFKSVIDHLESEIRSLCEFVHDTTGVITESSKRGFNDRIDDYRKAIAALKQVEKLPPASNTLRDAIAAAIHQWCEHYSLDKTTEYTLRRKINFVLQRHP